MTIEKLEYFYFIAKYNSISKASAELHVSKSALSSSLKNLEEEIGEKLFDRKGKGLALNSHGVEILEEVTGILEKIQNIKLGLHNNIKSPIIRIGIGNPSISHKINQSMSQSFNNNEFILDVLEGNSFELLGELSDNKLDCVITSASITSTILKKELIFEFDLFLCMSDSIRQKIFDNGINTLNDYPFLYLKNHLDHLDVTQNVITSLKLQSELLCCYESFLMAEMIKKGEGVYITLSMKKKIIEEFSSDIKIIPLNQKQKFYLYVNPLTSFFQYEKFITFLLNRFKK
ncbi:LysR family transcriptional regulator [Enterococcus gilvus]|uniref:LysR family transcriptional regulator n=1 Tax=Enterococcus gilvus TaxID=160453 RepID=UPI003ED93AC8